MDVLTHVRKLDMFWLLPTEHLSKSQGCSGGLEILDELGSRQAGFCLFESLNLLIPGSLADFEILHDEVARLVQCCFGLSQGLQLTNRGITGLSALNEELISFGFLGLLVGGFEVLLLGASVA